MARAHFQADFPWNEVLTDAVRRTGASGSVQLFLEQREDLTMSWADGEPSAVRTLSCGVSASRGRPVQELAYVADPSPDDVARVAASGASGASPATAGPRPWTLAPLAAEDMAAAVERVTESVRKLWSGVRTRATAVAFEQRIWAADAEIGCREDHRRSARLRDEVDANRGASSSRAIAETTRDFASGFGNDALERLAVRLVERLDRAFDRRELPPGEYVAILAPGIGGILAHEIVGHALEADTVRARASWLAALDGAVADLELRILDDPRRGRAAWRTDDEGIVARPTALIHGGRVAGALHDRSSAALDGVKPTGHGRRASFREPVMPRMGCTYVAAGRFDARELLESVERGVYIRRMEAASVDPRSGRAVFRVTDSDHVVCGKIAASLHPYLWIVEGPRALASLKRIADDLEFDTCIGSCHRDGQALAISVGAPTICIGVSGVMCTNIIESAEG